MAPTLSAEVGTVRVPSRQDDALRAEALGRQDGGQFDGAVADDGHGGMRPGARVASTATSAR
jgi:hypothetical protein